VRDALNKLHVTHPTMLATVMSFLEKLPGNAETSVTGSFNGAGGKRLLEARAYKNRLYLEAPPPAHVDINSLVKRNADGSPLTRKARLAQFREIIRTEVPDAEQQLAELNEHIGIYDRLPRNEKVNLRTSSGAILSVSPSNLEQLKLIVSRTPRVVGPPRLRPTDPKPPKVTSVRNRKLAVQNAIVLMDVLQQVVDYKHRPGDNRPPPGLWVDDREYLDMLRELLEELKKLNAALQASGSKGSTAKASISFTRSAQKFLDAAAVSAGKATGPLIIGALAGSIVYFAGVSLGAVSSLYKGSK